MSHHSTVYTVHRELCLSCHSRWYQLRPRFRCYTPINNLIDQSGYKTSGKSSFAGQRKKLFRLCASLRVVNSRRDGSTASKYDVEDAILSSCWRRPFYNANIHTVGTVLLHCGGVANGVDYYDRGPTIRQLAQTGMISKTGRHLSASFIGKQESLVNAKVNARQHCVVRSHWNAGNAMWRTTMFHVVASQTREITRNSERIRPYSSSRSSMVIDLGVNGKPICDFLLVINSNFSRIWYRFW